MTLFLWLLERTENAKKNELVASASSDVFFVMPTKPIAKKPIPVKPAQKNVVQKKPAPAKTKGLPLLKKTPQASLVQKETCTDRQS